MDVNKLAILTNILGGYDAAEEALNVDAELIQKAIEGAQLSGYEHALLETGFNKLYLEDDLGLNLHDLFGTNLNKFGKQTDRGTVGGDLNDVTRFLDRADLQNEFRSLLAEGVISLDDLSDGKGLFANLTSIQADKALQGLRDGTADAGAMFYAYNMDMQYTARFWDIENSAFWHWFRETFYASDDD